METNKIYNEDCIEGLKKLPDNCIDLVVTDPPYLINCERGCGFIKQERMERWCAEMQQSRMTEGFNLDVLDELCRVMKAINAYFFCSRMQLPVYLDYFVKERGCGFDVLIWHKTNPMPMFGGHYLSDKEYIVFVKDKNVKVHPACYEDGKTVFTQPINLQDKRKWGHPTIKPESIVCTLIRNSSQEGDIILDPFMGSGTTAVCAESLNRNFIGYEINEEFHKTAIARVQESRSKLF